MIIAIDFDGVLCKNQYPKIGEPNKELLKLIPVFQANGDKFILWTCRTGKELDEALIWCREFGIVFDAVNENLPERIETYGGDSRKVSADQYWDDKAYNMEFHAEDEYATAYKQFKEIFNWGTTDEL